LVLAQEQEKTRLSLAFSKLYVGSNWAKADSFFRQIRISPSGTGKEKLLLTFLPHTLSVKPMEKRDNPDARICFFYYKTMMGLIDWQPYERTLLRG